MNQVAAFDTGPPRLKRRPPKALVIFAAKGRPRLGVAERYKVYRLGRNRRLDRLMRRIVHWAALASMAITPIWESRAADAAISWPPPSSRWEIEMESAVIWKVGGSATPLSYTLLPQIISLKTSRAFERPSHGGTLSLRSRYSLLLEPILHGPERHYVGVTFAGELEWRDASQGFAAYFSSGGGFGWMNSKGYEIAGAQGQDFNFNWMIHTGARFRLGDQWWVSTGLYFQHISNHNLDKINPGLNALGPTLSVARKF